MFHPDVVVHDWMTPDHVVRGAQALTDLFSATHAVSFPDATEDVLATVFDGASLVVNATFRSTFAADYLGFPAHGGIVTWEVLDRWGISDGLITSVNFAANTAEAHRQLAREVGAGGQSESFTLG